MIRLRKALLNNPLLTIHLKVMRFSGLVVFDDQRFHLVHGARGLLTILIWTELVITELMDLFEQFGDFLKMTTNASFTLLILIIVGQCYQFLYYRSDLVTIIINEIDSSMNKIPSYSTDSEVHRKQITRILSKNIFKVKILTAIYYTSCLLTILIMITLSFNKYLQAGDLSVEERKNIDFLPIRAWYPVDIYENFIPIFIHQVIVSYVGLLLVPLLQTMIVAFMVHASAMLQVLKYRCETFTDGIEDVRSMDEQDLVLTKKLRDIVVTQLELVQFIQHLDELFRTSMFITFAVLSILLCSLLFQLSIIGLGADAIVPIFFICNMSIILLMFCWHANEIAHHSGTLPNSMYSSKWYQCSNKLKNLVLIYMLGSQRPMTLSAIYFRMTLETYISVLKASYSYFTLLSGISERG